MSQSGTRECTSCGFPSHVEELVLKLATKSHKYVSTPLKFVICDNESVAERCETCQSPMLLRTCQPVPENSEPGHMRVLLCKNPKCSHRKRMLKRLGLPCPRCGAEVVEVPNWISRDGLFQYQCLNSAVAKKEHGIESQTSGDEGLNDLIDKTATAVEGFCRAKGILDVPDIRKPLMNRFGDFYCFTSPTDEQIMGPRRNVVSVTVNKRPGDDGLMGTVGTALGRIADLTDELNQAINSATNNAWHNNPAVTERPGLGCFFTYVRDLLPDGSNHEPINHCPECGSKLKFEENESRGKNIVEIRCSSDSCSFHHN